LQAVSGRAGSDGATGERIAATAGLLFAAILPVKPTNADLGRAVARLRDERGLSVEELADIADCSPDWLYAAESGACSPTWSEIGRLAEALGLPASTLIGQAEDEARTR
jgi:ribosome-binding protein aMBF1 (putative translation factor)